MCPVYHIIDLFFSRRATTAIAEEAPNHKTIEKRRKREENVRKPKENKENLWKEMKIENGKGWKNKEKQLKTSKNDDHAGKPIQKTRKT